MRAIVLFALGVVVATATGRADPYSDARAAYDRGDFGTARETFLALAELGNAKAQTMMGNIYFCARGVRQDSTVALQWYRKSAALREPVAQYMSAQILATPAFEGFGPSRNNMIGANDVLLLMRSAAEQDYGPAQEMLGLWLTDNEAMPKNPSESFAFAGVRMMRIVDGIPKDNAEAALWLEKAAEHGDHFAQQSLAWRYAKGIGVGPDQSRALFWISLALRAPPPPPDLIGLNKVMRQQMESLRDEAGSHLSGSDRAAVEQKIAIWQEKPMPTFDTLPETRYEAASPQPNRFYFH